MKTLLAGNIEYTQDKCIIHEVQSVSKIPTEYANHLGDVLLDFYTGYVILEDCTLEIINRTEKPLPKL